jgi:intraflagellar transport protein 140
MKEEAIKLYEESKRYDLLNQFYQAGGEWTKAIKVSEKFDRINTKTTYYKLAKQFEVSREFETAIKYYEKAGTHKKDVPRMLL